MPIITALMKQSGVPRVQGQPGLHSKTLFKITKIIIKEMEID
jgi:hypothetical protein